MKKLIIYTDGACSGNPGTGGFSVLVKYGEGEQDIWTKSLGPFEGTTNNRMEFLALIYVGEEVLSSRHKSLDIELYTDSQLLVNTYNFWINNWESKDYEGKSNVDLLRRIYKIKFDYPNLKVFHVKGNSNRKRSKWSFTRSNGNSR
jgi:ribonuclease HI